MCPYLHQNCFSEVQKLAEVPNSIPGSFSVPIPTYIGICPNLLLYNNLISCDPEGVLEPFVPFEIIDLPEHIYGKCFSSFTTSVLFQHCPFLLPNGEDVQRVLDEWKEYKMGVPTYGAIILDETLENVSHLFISQDIIISYFSVKCNSMCLL